MSAYNTRKLQVATQPVENASPRCPQPSWRVKIQLSSRLSATAKQLTYIGVRRWSSA